jgi:chromosome segregation ATPase
MIFIKGLPRVMGAIKARFTHKGERVGQVEARVGVAVTRVDDHSHKIGTLQRKLQELPAACEHSERSVMGLNEHVAGYREEERSLGEQVASLRAENGELRRAIAEIDARIKPSPRGR